MLKKLFLLLILVCLPIQTAFGASYRADPRKHAALVIHADSGIILRQENADSLRHPASLTKLMTAYLTFEALDNRKLALNNYLTVSSKAASMPNIALGLRRGSKIKVETALEAAVIRSANDAAVVLAEAISGSEWQFAQKMTRKAKELGMTKTVFRNASGLPDSKQVTTAKDMARLLMALERDFPRYYNKYLSMTSFSYRGKRYSTHNKLMKNYSGAEAGKTGYIRASGFNLALSAKRKGSKIIGVVMGGKTSRTRDKYMVSILDTGFKKLGTRTHLISMLKGNVPTPVLKSSIPTPVASNATKTIRNLSSTFKAAALARADEEQQVKPVLKKKWVLKKLPHRIAKIADITPVLKSSLRYR
jgi:D-alanyl-D-alanine carboxypeptidase